MSPRIEDTPMGSESVMGGDWVPKEVFTDDIVVVVREWMKSNG